MGMSARSRHPTPVLLRERSHAHATGYHSGSGSLILVRGAPLSVEAEPGRVTGPYRMGGFLLATNSSASGDTGLAVFDSQPLQLDEPESATLERGALHSLT